MRPIVFSTLFLVVLGSACRTSDPMNTDGTWVGTITTEGNVTTVVNESGSVWGGTARLVEEASIGVEAGPDEYMLGRVEGVAADEDGVYVLDSQVPALRVYDLDGVFRRTIGAGGQGPGEFDRPDGLALGTDGNLYVRAFYAQRVNIYEKDGEIAATLSDGPQFRQRGTFRVLADGSVHLRGREGYVGFLPDGSTAETILYPTYQQQPVTVTTAGLPGPSGVRTPWNAIVPYSPRAVTELAPTGATISGFSDRYRFTLTSRDGRRTVIERRVEPVPIIGEERTWYEDRFHQTLRDDGGVEGGMPVIPTIKPFFQNFVPTHDGNLWVVRPGIGRQVQNCPSSGSRSQNAAPTECWQDSRVVDVFGRDGRYLGDVTLPTDVLTRPSLYITGDQVVAVVEDDAGTIMVKRYRLVLPGEEER